MTGPTVREQWESAWREVAGRCSVVAATVGMAARVIRRPTRADVETMRRALACLDDLEATIAGRESREESES